jgi:hypothetical protein
MIRLGIAGGLALAIAGAPLPALSSRRFALTAGP